MFSLKEHTIFLTLAGSQAHGTARSGSDVDLRGVCIAPLSLRLSIFHSFDQYDGLLPEDLTEIALPSLKAHPTAATALQSKVECVVFDIAKFVSLCSVANPNALEILFADERDWIYHTPTWRTLFDFRHHFLTQKLKQTFLGYSMAQLKKIQSHRAWLLSPPTQKPMRTDFGLFEHQGTLSRDDQNRIEQSIADTLRSYNLDTIEMPKSSRVSAVDRMAQFQRDILNCPENELDQRTRAVASHALNVPGNVMRSLNAEKKYRAAMKHWNSYQTWKTNRNPARAKLEERYGYDTKHAMHLIRLMRMGIEAMTAGDLFVRRNDYKDLIAIRDGELSYDELLREAASLKQRMERAAAQSQLPSDIDPDAVDQLTMELIRS